ncbi:MAG: hypothetical protein CM15mP126_3860 [Gammaproteobacteria bacterium]|nr:MAG: hypothetical protein CM15mP126_3860 [Gammaproteobacteria bacterium]
MVGESRKDGHASVTNIFFEFFFLSSIYSFFIENIKLQKSIKTIQIYNPFEIENLKRKKLFIMNDGGEIFIKIVHGITKNWGIKKT